MYPDTVRALAGVAGSIQSSFSFVVAAPCVMGVCVSSTTCSSSSENGSRMFPKIAEIYGVNFDEDGPFVFRVPSHFCGIGVDIR